MHLALNTHTKALHTHHCTVCLLSVLVNAQHIDTNSKPVGTMQAHCKCNYTAKQNTCTIDCTCTCHGCTLHPGLAGTKQVRRRHLDTKRFQPHAQGSGSRPQAVHCPFLHTDKPTRWSGHNVSPGLTLSITVVLVYLIVSTFASLFLVCWTEGCFIYCLFVGLSLLKLLCVVLCVRVHVAM